MEGRLAVALSPIVETVKCCSAGSTSTLETRAETALHGSRTRADLVVRTLVEQGLRSTLRTSPSNGTRLARGSAVTGRNPSYRDKYCAAARLRSFGADGQRLSRSSHRQTWRRQGACRAAVLKEQSFACESPRAVAAGLVVAAVIRLRETEWYCAAPNPIAAASAALGATSLKTIRYAGFGSAYSVGQNSDPLSPWPRVDVKKYEAAIDYGAAAMQVDITREQGPLQPRGGGQPFTGEQRQLQIVSGGVAWNVPYGPPPRSGRGRAAGPASDAAPSPPPSAPPQVSTPTAASSTPTVNRPRALPAAAAPPAPLHLEPRCPPRRTGAERRRHRP